ncbi:hypothetical protein DVK85_10565 [Flavobacterium arcticum]|uniref:YdhG-like domain-containing protein n=1 Tax=Flavobacterium arcticum TaxID=1784713 RepID=A0A345HDI9_9FLAO|nr:DUF1801 domain-containing protein [Flavobacterium arcticum]AXG74649.1 hypothetical protein DVK85_10565 [Flavobacterium arcticum]KAF2512224.1 hypothetical protein E0W72_03100 [Flavobacterium arcticum]
MDKKGKSLDSSHLWAEELDFLKSIIHKTGLVETTKWDSPVFTYNNKNVLGVNGFKDFFTIWFFKGVFLKDEGGLLINANEENTKSLRQWRFTSKDEINEKLVLQYIYEAIEVEKNGLEIKPEKKQTVVPEHLQIVLDNSTELNKAFDALSPYKQREYCEYIDSAKREATKLSRIEKCSLMILEGKGLNDKYR